MLPRTYILLLLTTALLLCACKTTQSVTQTEKEVRVVDRDTTIIVLPDSASILALLECDSTNNVIMKQLQTQNGERIQTQIVYLPTPSGGLSLQIDCNEDSLQRVIQWQDSIISIRTTTTQTQYIRRRNSYDKVTSAGFWILLCCSLGYIALKIYLTQFKV